MKSKLRINGYVKDLQSLNYQENLKNLTTGNLIHHRINIKWQPIQKITTAMEVRNRLFWGEEVTLIPHFSQQLRNKNEAVDLTWNPVDGERMILNSTIDRLWVEYAKAKWNVRLGRQRVNWGIGTTWNPNDLFNTYNFLDFDYEERPGIDGIKFQYITDEMDFIETTVSYSETSNDVVAALRYFKNIATYDLQFLAGMYFNQLTLGFGWSGSIRETGFKGELQYFFSTHEVRQQFNGTLEADYLFSKGWYVNVGMLLNSSGATSTGEVSAISNLQLSPRYLMPTKWNALFMLAKELSPLVSLNATFIYSPQTNLTMMLPSLSYNITEDLDINLVWQSFFIGQSTFDDVSHRCFLRFKWSY